MPSDTRAPANPLQASIRPSERLSIGRLEEAKETKGDTTTLSYKQVFEYDRFGNLFRKSASNPTTGQENPLPYTPIETSDIDPATNRFTSGTGTEYNDNGQVVTDNKFRALGYAYDALGRMVRVIEDPDTSNLATDYVFDTLGNVRKTTQGDQTRFFMHDSLGRLLYGRQVEQDANSAFSGSGYADPITGNNQWSVKYTYDDNSNITSTTDARNNTITATYDHLNRLVKRDYSDSSMPDVWFYYDGTGLGSVPANSKGKLTKVTSSVSETKYTGFDEMGRLTAHQQITDGETYSTAYTYNLSGGLIEETYPSTRVVRNTLNQDGDLSMVQSRKTSSTGFYAYGFGFEYDKNGALTKMRLGNGHWETYSYNNRMQIEQIGLGTTDSLQDILKLEFAYGTWETSGSTETLNPEKNNGAMAQQKITVPSVPGTSGFTATQEYRYDMLNRIHEAKETISGSQTWKQTFVYDRYGNRGFDSENTTTPANCTTAVCNPTFSATTNRISSSGYTFDADGNLTEDAEGYRFGYDSESRQDEYFDKNNSSSTPDATYYYDGEGRRVKKISSTETTVFVYDGIGRMIAEYSTDLAETQQVSYLTTDHLGSPRLITNEIGQVVKRQDFAAFGDETLTAARVSALGYTTADDLRQDYTGYQKDTESGLEYAQARYYNTAHGRFTSVDPLTASATIRSPQSFNRYSYALNSPYKFTDPLGLLAVGSGSKFLVSLLKGHESYDDGKSAVGDEDDPLSVGGLMNRFQKYFEIVRETYLPRMEMQISGDYYNRGGYYEGSDGIDDGKTYIVNEGVDTRCQANESEEDRMKRIIANSTQVGGLIIMTRTQETSNSTTSTLTTVGGTGSVRGYALEPAGPSTTQRNQDRRIPTGVYNLTPFSSADHPNTYVVSNSQVTASRRILIHSGNDAEHTSGCILPGSTAGNGTVSGSRAKTTQLLNYIRQNEAGGRDVLLIIR